MNEFYCVLKCNFAAKLTGKKNFFILEKKPIPQFLQTINAPNFQEIVRPFLYVNFKSFTGL